MRRHRPVPVARVLAPLLAVLALGLLPSASAAQTGTSAQACSGTFQVLNDTRIGLLALKKGAYGLTPQGGLGCADAAKQFTTFLNEAYDGDLAAPWRLVAAERRFVRGTADTGRGFTVTPLEGGGTEAATAGCPTPYTQPRTAKVGTLEVPRGRFQLTLVTGQATCQRLTELITGFLQSGRRTLPTGWTFSSETGRFTSARAGLAFRFRLVGEAGQGTEGGGSFPAKGTICPSSIRFSASDRLGALRVRRGRYAVATFGKLTCAEAARQVAAFGRKSNGKLNRPWVVDADTSVFTRGRSGADGFQLSRVSS